MLDRGVDIIIPIYNAYEELVKCINSIQKWTDLEKHRLILINDCSTDQRVARLLEKMKSENFIVIHNTPNQGFSMNINTGIAQSDSRDVVLLNSDTVVTKHWVEKMVQCAYRDPSIATVTPLSNNATLCSVPVFGIENKLPDGYTVDEYAELIEKVSLRAYPTIPVAHGFCMLVKREVINTIGNFDADTYGRGYGEENDFCCRAILSGYHHVMCDDTFILHTGTSSFVSDEKRKYMAEHQKILEKHYPKLMQDVGIHCRKCPTDFILQNIRMRTVLDSYKNRKTIMHLMGQGREEDFKSPFNVEKYNIVCAARHGDYLKVVFYAAKEELYKKELYKEELHFQFFVGERHKYEAFRSVEFAQLYGKILDAFGIACVNVHDIRGLSLELYYEAEKRKIPVFTTIHDSYFFCPAAKLVNESGKPCKDEWQRNCRRCLRVKKEIPETIDYASIWRNRHHKVLDMSAGIFVPTHRAREITESFYPDLHNKLIVTGDRSGQKANRLAAREYEQMHQETCVENDRLKWSQPDNSWLLGGYLMLDDRQGTFVELRSRLAAAERQLDVVYQSFSFRAASRLARLPVPFKKQIKGVISAVISGKKFWKCNIMM